MRMHESHAECVTVGRYACVCVHTHKFKMYEGQAKYLVLFKAIYFLIKNTNKSITKFMVVMLNALLVCLPF